MRPYRRTRQRRRSLLSLQEHGSSAAKTADSAQAHGDVGYISPEEASIAADEPVKLVGLKESGNTVGKYVKVHGSRLLDRQIWKGRSLPRRPNSKDHDRPQGPTGGRQAFTSLLPTGRIEEREGYSLTYPQCALVAIDPPQTGAIRALVGGRGEDEYNRATKAMRSPGSSMKPFVYTAAIDSGYTPATTMVDEPISYPMGDGSMWSPKKTTTGNTTAS